MEEFIKSLKLEATTEKALLGALGQEKDAWNKNLDEIKATALKEKEKVENDFKEFKNVHKDYDLVKEQLKTIQASEASLRAENEKISKSALNDKLDFEIEKTLMSKNAKHIDLLKNAIDKNSIEYDPEKKEFKGLNEAIQKTEESYKDLFNQAPLNSQKSAGTTGATASVDPKTIKSPLDWVGLVNSKR